MKTYLLQINGHNIVVGELTAYILQNSRLEEGQIAADLGLTTTTVREATRVLNALLREIKFPGPFSFLASQLRITSATLA